MELLDDEDDDEGEGEEEGETALYTNHLFNKEVRAAPPCWGSSPRPVSSPGAARVV